METKIFDIKLPTSWAELSDKQLLFLFSGDFKRAVYRLQLPNSLSLLHSFNLK